MKLKSISALCAALLLAATMTASGLASSMASPIGLDAALLIALEAAGLSESAAASTAISLQQRNGIDYYAVTFSANGLTYAYDIDALTGVVISSTSQPASQSEGPVTEEQAREIALAHAGLTDSQVSFLRSKLDRDDGRQVYEVEFYTADGKEYDYEIDVTTGSLLAYDYDTNDRSLPAAGSTTLSSDKAKEIALGQVPGATDSHIAEFEVDHDDGRLEYEGTIYYGGAEYEFTIDGYSGAIREWSVEFGR